MADGGKGYIKLHRELQDNPLWNSEPFSKGQAWVDLLLRANHQHNEFIVGNELIVVERGQFFTSELKLAEKWKWSRKKVRAYLNFLKTLKMATTVGTSKGTTITIENYGLYQGEGTAEDTTEGTSKEHQRNIKGYTNNNDKELIKNDKEINTNKIPYQEIVEYLNENNNSNYRHTTKSNKSLIDARFNEGFVLEDFKKVIDNKVSEWQGTEFEKFLRPQTLFGTKFESYLNQKKIKKLNHEGREIDDSFEIPF